MAHRLRRLFFTATLNPKPQTSPKTTPSKPRNPPTQSQTVNRLYKELCLDCLTLSFKTSSNSCSFRSRIRIFESVVGRLSAANRKSSIIQIIDFQKQFKKDFKREGHGMKLIKLYGMVGMMEDAKRTFEEIGVIEGAVRTVKSFNVLLTVYDENGEFGRVVDAFEKVPEGIVLDAISYDILIKAHCIKGDLDKALNALHCLKSYNLLHNRVWFYPFSSDALRSSINAELNGLVSEGRISEARNFIDYLEQLRLDPDTFTYNALIERYCKDGNIEEALTIYNNMDDFAPDRGTFSILIPALCEAGWLDHALIYCSNNICRRKLVEARVLQDLVNKLVLASRVDDAKKLVALATEKNVYSKKVLKMPPN